MFVFDITDRFVVVYKSAGTAFEGANISNKGQRKLFFNNLLLVSKLLYVKTRIRFVPSNQSQRFIRSNVEGMTHMLRP